jgi:hypothetical protein
MLPYFIVGGLLAVPVLLGFFMRVSAPHIFFSVMAGELLARYFGQDAVVEAEKAFRNPYTTQYAELAILTLPIILTALILKGTISISKNILNLIPLVITGVVYASFALPLLPADVQATIASNPLGQELLNTSSTIIGVVVLIQLVALWVLNRGEKSKKRGKK